jgi:site-specific DNA-methyltransferase (adenine-specific)/modification methylase
METKTFCSGKITAIFGDCRELEIKADEIGGIVSDPPYGIGFQYHYSDTRIHTGKVKLDFGKRYASKKIFGDDVEFDPTWMLKLKTKTFLFGADHFFKFLPKDYGIMMAWDKCCGQGDASQFSDTEFMWCSRKSANRIYHQFWRGCMREGMDAGTSRYHVSQKPVELMMWAIDKTGIKLDSVVFDPYMGSGSTGIAAIMSGRRFLGAEIDRENFDIACKRFAALESDLFYGQ